jgi:tRNA (mo5U34)-methyltransferase
MTGRRAPVTRRIYESLPPSLKEASKRAMRTLNKVHRPHDILPAGSTFEFADEGFSPPLRASGSSPEFGRAYELQPLPASPGELKERLQGSMWFHEIDLGNGVSTVPAVRSAASMREDWELFALGDLSGRSLIDVGGMDGGFAFMAEKAGAAKVAVLDHYIWSTDSDEYDAIFRACLEAGRTPPAPHETTAWHPESLPTRWRFDLARRALGSSAEGIVMDFMDGDVAEVGTWDVVLYLGVLYHMTDPIEAMSRVAAITGEQAIIETLAMHIPGHPEPLWRFYPGSEYNNDRTNWFVPNVEALVGIAQVAGFRGVEVLRAAPGDLPGRGPHHYRAIIRATK